MHTEFIKLNTKKQTIQFKNGQMTWINASPKRTYRWQIVTWKNAQHCESSDEHKLEPQWHITSHLSEWPSLINQQTSVGEDAEKKNPCALLVEMQVGAATVEHSMELPQKIKNRTASCSSYFTAENL